LQTSGTTDCFVYTTVDASVPTPSVVRAAARELEDLLRVAKDAVGACRVHVEVELRGGRDSRDTCVSLLEAIDSCASCDLVTSRTISVSDKLGSPLPAAQPSNRAVLMGDTEACPALDRIARFAEAHDKGCVTLLVRAFSKHRCCGRERRFQL
jgi:hypothetical protein